jgi:hypothetical protein
MHRAHLGLADGDKRPDLAEIGDPLVVARPGVVFIIERLMEHADFDAGKYVHDAVSAAEEFHQSKNYF